MSTKATIRHRQSTAERVGFHLYDDVFDTLGVADTHPEPPVYLQLDGIGVQIETRGSMIASVTLTLPRELARELGLLPAVSATTPGAPT